MGAIILKGSDISKKIIEDIGQEVKGLSAKPVLASIEVGENSSSSLYINAQKKACEKSSLVYRHVKLDQGSSQKDLIEKIQQLNQDKEVSAMILQMPLPPGLDQSEALEAISASKDAEGLHPKNLGKLMLGAAQIFPCTCAAVMEMIRATKVNLRGKEAVVVGHSDIVGKPLSMLLLKEFATTRVCHIATSEAGNLEKHIRDAEVLIVAVGKANFVKASWIKKGAIVIDVGINKVGEKIVGDVEFEAAKEQASYITPVPGGVGPLTVAMLMKNVLTAYKISNKIN